MGKYQRTTFLTTLFVSVLIGLGLVRKTSLVPNFWLFILIPLLFLFKNKKLSYLLFIASAGLLIGLWRGGQYMQNVYQLSSLSSQGVVLEATASSDALYAKNSQISFTASNISLIQPQHKALSGSFKISGFGVPMVYRGDQVRVSGKLYPSRGSNQGRISYAQISRLAAGSSFFNDLSRRFNAGMQNALPEPLASFSLGLLIGQRSTLPVDITAALTAVGLVHIVAVSGYNLTIIIRGISRLRLGSKFQKLAVSLALIAGFVLITGFSASIVRAALVSVLSLWAWYYGRRIKPLVLISFAAAATALWNPFYVWGDLSWYLSFLAFFGVLVIAPAITQRLFRKTPGMLTLVLIETLSAELMTLPLILMTFGQLSLVALLANILIVPLVPLAMLLGAVAGTAGMFIPAFAGWAAWPARLLLTYMLDLIRLLSVIPSVFIQRSISVATMIGSYSVVALVTLVMYKKLPQRPDTIADEPMINTLGVVK
jgi:competence protein ComEC